jgi:hypothetical protein
MDILTNIDFWQNVVLIATLLFMIIEFIRQRKETQRAIYQELHSAYLSFLQFCMEHPGLGLSEFDETELQSFKSIGGNKELLDACNVLVALWENAFLMRSSMSKGQWDGWEIWIRDYLRRSEKVRKGVSLCIDWYDPGFVKFVKRIISEIG